jgi:WD40 repeat protein
VFLHGSSRLATAGADGRARVWDWRNEQQLAELRGTDRSVLALAVTPDDALLASGGEDGTLRLWDPVIGEQRGALQPGIGAITSLAFSPDGQSLAAGGDGRVRVWQSGLGLIEP